MARVRQLKMNQFKIIQQYFFSDDNPVYEAIRQIKKTFGNKVLIAVDICLCPYTTSGHCGVFFSNGQEEIDNEKSIGILAEMAGKMA